MAERKPFVWGASGVELLQTGDTLAGASSGGGEIVLLSEATANDTASIDFTGLDNSVYYQHIVAYNSLRSVADSTYLLCLVNIGGIWRTTGYYGVYFNGAQRADDNNARISAVYSQNYTGDFKSEGAVKLSLCAEDSIYKIVYADTSNGYMTPIFRKSFTNNINLNAVTGLRFILESGNILTGVFRLYGVKA